MRRKTKNVLTALTIFSTSLFVGVIAQEDKELDAKIEKIVEEKLKEKDNQQKSEEKKDLFSYTKDSLGVEIHGHLQFEYEDYESEGSRGGDSTFDNQYFTLWVGKEINEYLQAVIEIEYEHGGTSGQTGGTGGGGGGETEIDQALVKWKPLGKDDLQINIGKFYVPFGIERFSYAGPSNRLVSRPAPFQRIYPGTYADTGLAAQGNVSLMGSVTGKYEIAVVNGLGPDAAVDIRDARQGRDNSDNKAVVGRLALNFDEMVEVGTSFYDGKYNEFQSNGHALVPDNELSLTYNGVDARFTYNNFDFRGEWIYSRVDTGETATNGFRNFHRDGYYVQGAYRFEMDRKLLKYLDAVVRFDSKDENSTVKNTADTNTWALGATWGVYENMAVKFEHQLVHERGPEKIDNDAFLAQVSVKF